MPAIPASAALPTAAPRYSARNGGSLDTPSAARTAPAASSATIGANTFHSGGAAPRTPPGDGAPGTITSPACPAIGYLAASGATGRLDIGRSEERREGKSVD